MKKKMTTCKHISKFEHKNFFSNLNKRNRKTKVFLKVHQNLNVKIYQNLKMHNKDVSKSSTIILMSVVKLKKKCKAHNSFVYLKLELVTNQKYMYLSLVPRHIIEQTHTLVANLRELSVSWKHSSLGDTFTNIRVLLLPPREFWRRQVSLDSLYGMYPSCQSTNSICIYRQSLILVNTSK